MKASLTIENRDAVLSNIRRMLAEMKSLGMGPHDVFGDDREIIWCHCWRCVRKFNR